MREALEYLVSRAWKICSLFNSVGDPRISELDQYGPREAILPWQSASGSVAPVQQGPTRILLLGRAGCGKTYLVETACSNEGRIDSNRIKKKTSAVSSHRITLETPHEQSFKLIDSSGFDNPSMSNLEVFSNLVGYLTSRQRQYYGIAGVIYIHHSGDEVESRALMQNIRVISNLILGDSGLSRLTIMVVPGKSQPRPSPSIAQALSCATVFRMAYDKGARIIESPLHVEDIDTVLLSYASCKPILLRIQEERIRNPSVTFETQIEEILGYVDKNLIQPRIDEQIMQYLDPYNNQIQSLEAAMKDRDSQLRQYSSHYKQVSQQLARSQGETLDARQQLQQTQSEYASLRSQLQLQENIEQSDIVQALKDLNRDIEDYGRSISAFLVDNFVQKSFEKDLGEVTALDARHLPELKTLLGHVEGESSLIASSDLLGMPVEDFFDYSIRSMLCGYLWARIFYPFHPGIDASQNDTLTSMYEDVQKREPQAVAGKWRANSFKSVFKDENQDLKTQQVTRITEGLADDILTPLVTHFFGEEVGARVEGEHLERLTRLVQTAWDWNSTLQGEVIMLGDYFQSFYRPLHDFDSDLMEEFEPNTRFHPTSILGTIGLGLIAFRATGGGQVPEKTIVLKAMVATAGLYA